MKTVSSLLERVPSLFRDLAKILTGEIDCSFETLRTYSVDGSPYTIMPQAVVFPKNSTDIKHVLSFAREHTMPVTVRGKGKARTGGALGEGIILDMSRYFSQIRNVNMIENLVTVDAGVTVGELVHSLHGWHFDIPCLDLGDKETTLGALFATRSASTSSFCHGTLREWVEGVTVILDNGEEHHIADGITPSGRLLGIYQEIFPLLTKESGILRAAKPKSHDSGTGYNLWNTSIGPRQLIDQLAGSEGTLGIVTSITFRTSVHKPHKITTCIPVIKKELLATYVNIAKHHHAEHVFMYDQTFMQLAERYHPNVVPFFVDSPYTLLVTHCSSDKEKLHHLVRAFKKALPVEEYVLKTIEDHALVERISEREFLLGLTDLYTNKTLIPILSADGLIVTTNQVPVFLQQLEDYLDSIGRLYLITGNLASGHISVTTLFDPLSRSYEDDLVHYAKNIFSLIKEHGGGISATGGEGLTRTPYLHYAFNDAVITLFKKIKDVWDPLTILNPGKKLGSSTTYLQQRLLRTTHVDK